MYIKKVSVIFYTILLTYNSVLLVIRLFIEHSHIYTNFWVMDNWNRVRAATFSGIGRMYLSIRTLSLSISNKVKQKIPFLCCALHSANTSIHNS